MCFDGESPAVFTEIWRKARKEHQCCECGGVIAKGESYQCVTGCWDGSWDTYKTCEPCQELRDAIATEENRAGCFGAEAAPAFGTLIEAAADYGYLCVLKEQR